MDIYLRKVLLYQDNKKYKKHNNFLSKSAYSVYPSATLDHHISYFCLAV